MNKKLLATILALGIIASVGYLGTSYVLANENSPVYGTLVSRIAQKFNLKESDVEAVFTAVRDERQAEMKIQKDEKLSQAVSDGVITEAQKTALITKMDKNHNERAKNREEMQKWISDQRIDETKLRGYLGFGGMGRRMGMGRMGMGD